MIDLLNTPCMLCDSGKYIERSLIDDFQGIVECSNYGCNSVVKRWQKTAEERKQEEKYPKKPKPSLSLEPCSTCDQRGYYKTYDQREGYYMASCRDCLSTGWIVKFDGVCYR